MIQVLDSFISDKIAAGEVIERPLSIVKDWWRTPSMPGPTALCRNSKRRKILHPGNGQRLRNPGGGSGNCFRAPCHRKDSDTGRPGTYRYPGLSRRGAGQHLCHFQNDIVYPNGGVSGGNQAGNSGRVHLREGTSGMNGGTTMVVEDVFYNTPGASEIYAKRCGRSFRHHRFRSENGPVLCERGLPTD